MNIQHQLSLLDLHGALLLGPFPLSSQSINPEHDRSLRVADIGTGTGIWAVEFAQKNPSVHVVGFDLELPRAVPDTLWPDNVHFAVQDITDSWPVSGPAAGPFDLIHGRQLLLNLRNPESALRRVWENLRPGGMVEFRESCNPMVSEMEDNGDGGDTHTPLLVEWHRGSVQAAERLGCDHGYAARLPAELEKAGFVDVEFSDSKIPIGGWTVDGGVQDKRTSEMDAVLCEMIRVGVPGMTRDMFPKGLGWSEEKCAEYAAAVVNEFERKDLSMDKIYLLYRNVWARKPIV